MINIRAQNIGKEKYFVMQGKKRQGLLSEKNAEITLSSNAPVTFRKSVSGNWLIDRILSFFFLIVLFVLLVLSGDGISENSPEDEMVYLELTACGREGETLLFSVINRKPICDGAERQTYRIVKGRAYMVAASYAVIVCAVAAAGAAAVAAGAIEQNLIACAVGGVVLVIALFSAFALAKKFRKCYAFQLQKCQKEAEDADER